MIRRVTLHHGVAVTVNISADSCAELAYTSSKQQKLHVFHDVVLGANNASNIPYGEKKKHD